MFVWAVLAILLVAFFRTQILGHGKYQLQSESNRLRPIPLPAPRGIIFDRNGKVLADNVPGYTVSLLPGPAANLRATLARIAPIARLDAAAIQRQRPRTSPRSSSPMCRSRSSRHWRNGGSRSPDC